MATIKKRLAFLYGEKVGLETADELSAIIERHRHADASSQRRTFSEQDIVLITYADMVRRDGELPLVTLETFLRDHCADIVNTIHFLPFFPYSSDDGFAVIDYRSINPEFGDWSDVERFRSSFRLMFDAVINHVSSQNEWFQRFLNGDSDCESFFITKDPDEDLSMVVRPRSLPLLTKFATKNGPHWLWTTFSEDQIDLNYANPAVLLEIIDTLLFYADRGASIVRLDAIAYLWKKSGTSCIHLPETQEVVKLFRDVFDEATPDVAIITETNVPHQENMSYFGEHGDEAQMIYNFSLPPLTAHAILREDAEALTQWASTLRQPGFGNTYFNFTASHDGIGVTPAKGLIPDEEIDFLAERAIERGGFVSTKRLGDGSDVPYELNVNYLDLLADPEEDIEVTVDKFILSQSIMLCMPGVPGIYFHSLFGSRNDKDGTQRTGRPRSINREKPKLDDLVSELNNESSIRHRVHERYKRLLAIRRQEPTFNPSGSFEFPALSPSLFIVSRRSPTNSSSILAVHNVSARSVEFDPVEAGVTGDAVDAISGARHTTGSPLQIAGRQVVWLKF